LYSLPGNVNVEEFAKRLNEAARRAGFQVCHYGKVGPVELPVLLREGGPGGPQVYISSGVHGNEPAGPMAVLELLQRRAFPENFSYTVFPLVNPDGLAARTRENASGIDLNRDYGPEPRAYETRAQLDWIGLRQYDLVLCLHEDDDGEGFYLYQHIEHPTRFDYAETILQAAEPHTGIDGRTVIDDMPARKGRMFPPESVIDLARHDLPEALRLHFHHGSRFTFTTESPSRQSMDRRIAAQCAASEAIFRTFAEELPLPGRRPGV